MTKFLTALAVLAGLAAPAAAAEHFPVETPVTGPSNPANDFPGDAPRGAHDPAESDGDE